MSRACPGVVVLSNESSEREQLFLLGLAWKCGWCHGSTLRGVVAGDMRNGVACNKCLATGFVLDHKDSEEETERIVRDLGRSIRGRR